ISLQPNSLYIFLIQILSVDPHWSLFITDAAGVATRYHWSVAPRRSLNEPIECYDARVINPVREVTNGGKMTLGVVRIMSYSPPQPGFDFNGLFSQIYRGISYNTVQMNRLNHISCWEWVLEALNLL
ncbi:hypothetical protein PUNSTDRAFT_33091, partial [Punctularia strigosozonata HHB-11173 SS5]